MHEQNARDPPGQPQGERNLADNQSGDINVRLELTSQNPGSTTSPWHGVGELSFRVPTLGVATASRSPRIRHGSAQQQIYNFPGQTLELHELDSREEEQLTDGEGGAKCRGLAGDDSTRAPEELQTLTKLIDQAVEATSCESYNFSYSSEAGTLAAATKTRPEVMLPPPSPPPQYQVSPTPRGRLRRNFEEDGNTPSSLQAEGTLEFLGRSRSASVTRPRPVNIPVGAASRVSTTAQGARPAACATTATAAVTLSSNHAESDAQQQPQQQQGVLQSELISMTLAAPARGLRRRSGTNTLPIQQPRQSAIPQQRNQNRVLGSQPPLPDPDNGQHQQPILLHTRMAAELSIRSIGGDGGGPVWTSTGGGCALGEVDEQQQRLSWGSYDGCRGGTDGANGVPYDAEQAQGDSWGSCIAAEMLYGGSGSGTHGCMHGGGTATVTAIGAAAPDGSSGIGGAGSGGDDIQLPSPRSASPGSSPGLLRSPAPSPVAASPRLQSVVARQRWHRALAAVGEVHLLHRRARTLADKESAPADRLFAALSLALQRRAWDKLLAANPHRLLLRHYMEKKMAGQWTSLWERLEAEFMIAGTIVFDWCTPARMGEHWPLFTMSFLAVAAFLFAFMAGEYPYFAVQEAEAARGCRDLAEAERADLAAKCWSSCFLSTHSGPQLLMDVLLHPGSLPATTFSSAFLRAWGGLYPPDVQRGQAYRHAAANLALTAALGWQMEAKYGTVRVMVVWLAAVVGGELLSTAVEDPCRQVVGCSGGTFGLLGLFCADTLLHFPRLRQPILRCATIGVLLGFMVYTLAVQQGNVSSMVHVGGLLCGLLPSLLVVPRLGSERWEAAWPVLGLSAVLVWFSVLPAWVYTRRLPMAAVRCA